METRLGLKPAVAAGLIAGIVFLMAEMALLAMSGQSPFGPPRMMAAMVMGESVLPPPATFDMGIMMVAMMVHFMLSIVTAFVFGALYKMVPRGLLTALVLGVLFGIAFYFFAFYAMTTVWPWFAMARGMISIAGHMLFGLALGWVYHRYSGVEADA